MSETKASKAVNANSLRRSTDSVVLRTASGNGLIAAKPPILATQANPLNSHTKGLNKQWLTRAKLSRLKAYGVVSRYAHFNLKLNPLNRIMRTLRRLNHAAQPEDNLPEYNDEFQDYYDNSDVDSFEELPNSGKIDKYNRPEPKARTNRQESNLAPFFEFDTDQLMSPIQNSYNSALPLSINRLANKQNWFNPITQVNSSLQRKLLDPRQTRGSSAYMSNLLSSLQPANYDFSPLTYRKAGQDFNSDVEASLASPDILRSQATSDKRKTSPSAFVASTNSLATQVSPFFVSPASTNSPVNNLTTAESPQNYSRANINGLAYNSNLKNVNVTANQNWGQDQLPIEHYNMVQRNTSRFTPVLPINKPIADADKIISRAASMLLLKQSNLQPPLSVSARAFVTSLVPENSVVNPNSIRHTPDAPFIQRDFGNSGSLLTQNLESQAPGYTSPSRTDSIYAEPVNMVQPLAARKTFESSSNTSSEFSQSAHNWFTPNPHIESNPATAVLHPYLEAVQPTNFAQNFGRSGQFVFGPPASKPTQTSNYNSPFATGLLRFPEESQTLNQVSIPPLLGERSEYNLSHSPTRTPAYILRQPDVVQNRQPNSQSSTQISGEAISTQISSPVLQQQANVHRMFVEPNLSTLLEQPKFYPSIFTDNRVDYRNNPTPSDHPNTVGRAFQNITKANVGLYYPNLAFERLQSQPGLVDSTFTPFVMRYDSTSDNSTLHNENVTSRRQATSNYQTGAVISNATTDPGKESSSRNSTLTESHQIYRTNLDKKSRLADNSNTLFPVAVYPTETAHPSDYSSVGNILISRSMDNYSLQPDQETSQSVIFAPSLVFKQLHKPDSLVEGASPSQVEAPTQNYMANLGWNPLATSPYSRIDPQTNNNPIARTGLNSPDPNSSSQTFSKQPNSGLSYSSNMLSEHSNVIPGYISQPLSGRISTDADYNLTPLVMRKLPKNQDSSNSRSILQDGSFRPIPLTPAYPPLPFDVLKANLQPLNSPDNSNFAVTTVGQQVLGSAPPTNFASRGLDSLQTNSARIDDNRKITFADTNFSPFVARQIDYSTLSDNISEQYQSSPNPSDIFAAGMVWRQLQGTADVTSPSRHAATGHIPSQPGYSSFTNILQQPENNFDIQNITKKFIMPPKDVVRRTVVSRKTGSIVSSAILTPERTVGRTMIPKVETIGQPVTNQLNRNSNISKNNIDFEPDSKGFESNYGWVKPLDSSYPDPIFNRTPAFQSSDSDNLSEPATASPSPEKSGFVGQLQRNLDLQYLNPGNPIGVLNPLQPLTGQVTGMQILPKVMALRSPLNLKDSEGMDIGGFAASQALERDLDINYAMPPLMTRKAQVSAPPLYENRTSAHTNDFGFDTNSINAAEDIKWPARVGRHMGSHFPQNDLIESGNFPSAYAPLPLKINAEKPFFAKPLDSGIGDNLSQPYHLGVPLPATAQRTFNFPFADTKAGDNQSGEEFAFNASAASPVFSQPLTFIQRKAAASSPLSVSKAGLNMASNVLSSSVGKPLHRETSLQMSNIFQRSFENVRVHDTPQAANLASQIGAEAFTIGSNIFFGSDRYKPQTQIGRALIGHELTHVVQQANLPKLINGGMLETSNQGHVFEHEAIQNEKRIFQHLEVNRTSTSDSSPVQRTFEPSHFQSQSGSLSDSNFMRSGQHIQRIISEPPVSPNSNSYSQSQPTPVQRVLTSNNEHGNASEDANKQDIDELAQKVLRLLRKEILVERERKGIISNNWF